MSEYTTTLRDICEGLMGRTEHVEIDELRNFIYKCAPELFNFESNNQVAVSQTFRERFILRYWAREICCETVGEWKLYLRQLLDKDAYKWNSLLETVEKKYPIFQNIYIVKEGDTQKIVDSSSTNTGKQTATSNSSGKSTNKYSDTPSSNLNNVEQGEYLTSYTSVSDTNNGTTNATTNGSNDYAEDNKVNYRERTTGKTGDKTNTEIMLEYRQSLFDIEEQLIVSLEPLFFGLW